MSLTRIRDVLAAGRQHGDAPCADVRVALRDRIADIDATVARLLALRATLERICAGEPNPGGNTAICPLIEGTAAPSSKEPTKLSAH